MNTQLAILINNDAENTLVGFPYQEGQFHSHDEESQDNDDQTWLYIELGEYQDTTAAQEAFLNSRPGVVGYDIV